MCVEKCECVGSAWECLVTPAINPLFLFFSLWLLIVWMVMMICLLITSCSNSVLKNQFINYYYYYSVFKFFFLPSPTPCPIISMWPRHTFIWYPNSLIGTIPKQLSRVGILFNCFQFHPIQISFQKSIYRYIHHLCSFFF